MAWVDTSKPEKKVGSWVKTTKIHRSPTGQGYFERGTLVQIIAIDNMRGYSIADDKGHMICELGWTI